MPKITAILIPHFAGSGYGRAQEDEKTMICFPGKTGIFSMHQHHEALWTPNRTKSAANGMKVGAIMQIVQSIGPKTGNSNNQKTIYGTLSRYNIKFPIFRLSDF